MPAEPASAFEPFEKALLSAIEAIASSPSLAPQDRLTRIAVVAHLNESYEGLTELLPLAEALHQEGAEAAAKACIHAHGTLLRAKSVVRSYFGEG